jgi:hypothetical protein
VRTFSVKLDGDVVSLDLDELNDAVPETEPAKALA